MTPLLTDEAIDDILKQLFDTYGAVVWRKAYNIAQDLRYYKAQNARLIEETHRWSAAEKRTKEEHQAEVARLTALLPANVADRTAELAEVNAALLREGDRKDVRIAELLLSAEWMPIDYTKLEISDSDGCLSVQYEVMMDDEPRSYTVAYFNYHKQRWQRWVFVGHDEPLDFAPTHCRPLSTTPAPDSPAQC